MQLHIGWPQGIYLALIIMDLVLMAYKHGKPRKNYSIWEYVVSAAIVLTLLFWGGFFS